MSLTDGDIVKVREVVKEVVKEEVPPIVRVEVIHQLEPFAGAIQQDLGHMDGKLDKMDGKIDKIYNLMDGFVNTSRRHEQELVVVQAQQKKMRDVLVKKGIGTEDEFAIA